MKWKSFAVGFVVGAGVLSGISHYKARTQNVIKTWPEDYQKAMLDEGAQGAQGQVLKSQFFRGAGSGLEKSVFQTHKSDFPRPDPAPVTLRPTLAAGMPLLRDRSPGGGGFCAIRIRFVLNV